MTRMHHVILFRQEGLYAPFPVLNHLADGRLVVGIYTSPYRDHHALGPWRAATRWWP